MSTNVTILVVLVIRLQMTGLPKLWQ